MTGPRVTFLVTAFNSASTVEASLGSLVAQTDPDWVALVVDDGSDDGTADVVATFIADEPRIRLIRSSHAGRPAALNQALSFADTEFVAIQDADDVSVPQRLELSLGMADGFGLDVVGGQLAEMDARGFWRSRGAAWPTREDAIRAGLGIGRMTIANPTVLMRTELVRAVGGYSLALPRCQDLDLLRRLLPQATFGASADILAIYRHPRWVSWGYFRRSRQGTRAAVALSGETLRPGLRSLLDAPSFIKHNFERFSAPRLPFNPPDGLSRELAATFH